jgi:hypothetical protein
VSNLQLFIKQRDAIRAQLFEDSENAVQNTIQSLAWYDSIYLTFNEGLRLSKRSTCKKSIPISLVEYIHEAHLAYVVLTLRKLYDKKREGGYAVNSLRSITQRIMDNNHLYSRENYVVYDGTPYEINKKYDWKTNAIIEGRHLAFDLLNYRRSGCKRKTNDKPNPQIAIQLHKGTVLMPKIEKYANKFLLHSAAQNNRPDEGLTFRNLTLLSIQHQYRRTIWVCQQIGRFLCEPVLTEVPTPQFDVLEQWGNGLFDDHTKQLLLKYWDKRMAWWMKWTKYYGDSNRIYLSPRG